jgi:hypothetical protein
MAKCSYCGQEGHNRLKCPVEPRDKIKEAVEEALKKVAQFTVISSIIGGCFTLAVSLIENHGVLTPDFSLGFVVGLAVGAGIGFGFGILFVLKGFFESGFFEKVIAWFKKT